MQKEVFQAMKEGNAELEALNREISIEQVEQLMEDTAEAIAYQEEVNKILSQNLSVEDDNAVLEELRRIEQEEVRIEFPNVPIREQSVEMVHEEDRPVVLL